MNEKQILVSVIVPVYNVEAYVGQCIDSILCQTYPAFELLLIDDGSTDQSGRICREAAASDGRVQYYKKENGGLSDARNYGMERAKGEYLTFIDSDDYVEETYLETLLELCVNWSAGISCVDFAMLGRKGDRKGLEHCTGREECLHPVEALKRSLISDPGSAFPRRAPL